MELQDRVAGDTIGPAASCELDSVPSPKVVGGGGDDKLLPTVLGNFLLKEALLLRGLE